MSSEDPRKNWFEEVLSAWLYRRVAAAEPDQRKRRLFESLADAALEQARTWQTAAGMSAAAAAGFRPTLRARVVAVLVRWLGVRPLKPALIAMKLRGLSVYGSAAPGHAMPTSVEQVGDWTTARHQDRNRWPRRRCPGQGRETRRSGAMRWPVVDRG